MRCVFALSCLLSLVVFQSHAFVPPLYSPPLQRSQKKIAPEKIEPEEQEKPQAAILYGEGGAFSILPPKGWELDSESGASQIAGVVLYPEGGSWENSKSVMYVYVSLRKGRDNSPKLSLEKFVKDDIEAFRKNHSKLMLTKMKSISTKDRLKSLCYVFDKVGNGADKECVTYLETKEHIFVVTLSCRSSAVYKKDFPDYEKLVSSFFFMNKTPRELAREAIVNFLVHKRKASALPV